MFTSRQHSENECETPLGSRQAFFRANLSTECLVGFLGREISTTAYGRWQDFPLRVGDAFHWRVSQVISYKFTALLLSVYLPLIIKGMPFGRARLCASRHAINVFVYQIETGRLYLLCSSQCVLTSSFFFRSLFPVTHVLCFKCSHNFSVQMSQISQQLLVFEIHVTVTSL